MVVTDLLVEHFPEIVDVAFTATMEEDLDEIAVGHKDWPEVLRQFYDPFERLLEKKEKEITRDDLIKETTDEKCPKCEGPMIIKLGRYGKFLSCANYPDCKGTRQIDGTERPEPTRSKASLRGLRRAAVAAPRTVRPVHRMLEVPGVQVHQEGNDRREVPEVRRRQAAAATVEEAPDDLLRMHAVSRVRLHPRHPSAGPTRVRSAAGR